MPNRRINTMQLATKQPDPYGLATTYKFDQGSYVSFAETATAGTYRITPKLHWNSKWVWWAIKSGIFSGQTPHFLIAKASHYNLVEGEWLACWSTAADTDTWTQFATVTIGASDIEFYHSSAFPSGVIYVACMPMYPFSRTQRKMGLWTANALTGQTASTTNFKIGEAKSRDNFDGRIVPALPFYGLKLTNATANTKNKSILTSGNHPHETPGNYQIEGAIDWLLATSVKQKFLLDWFEFFVYPSVNPQGRAGGWFRSGPEHPTYDHNRYWDTSGTEDIDAFKTAFTADTEDVIEVGFDYHCWMAADGAKSVAKDSTTTNWVAFLAAMAAQDATFVKRVDDTTASMLGNYWANLGTPAKLAGHIDHGLAISFGPVEWKLVGQKTMIALANMLAAGYWTKGPGVGSRDFNGSTDRIDWASVADLTNSNLTISAWVYMDRVGASQYFLNLGVGNAVGICLNNPGSVRSGALQLYVAGTTAMFVSSDTSYLATSAWIHVLATRATGFGLATSYIKLYKNGVESPTYRDATTGAAESNATGGWSMGGRIDNDARNFDGKMAQVAVWNRVLNSTEIAALAAGQAPDLAAASGLLFYFKGNTSSLSAVPPTATGTADGTTSVTGVGNGPAIIYG